MLNFLRIRARQGTRTSSYPNGEVEFPERYRGRPSFDPTRCGDSCRACAHAMPSALLVAADHGAPRIDVGAGLFSPDEASACPHGAIQYTTDHCMAASQRDGLVGSDGTVQLADELSQRMRQLFGRSLRLRSVAAGSCNGCDAE